LLNNRIEIEGDQANVSVSVRELFGVPRSFTHPLDQILEPIFLGARLKSLRCSDSGPRRYSAPAARNVPQHSLLCGSPATVAEAISKIDAIGVGGLILAFRIGPMPGEVAEQSIRLFMQQVAPEFRSNAA
jgi:alkanesulfonate monooxygenase SsuD/methylene tetrahydromethanopterin reductase-like flavin-dependent oxidoreductase (luciferase family)